MAGLYQKYAPGWPGIPAKWTSSAKSGVGTALNAASRVWFTLSHGIFNEIYYPRVDRAAYLTRPGALALVRFGLREADDPLNFVGACGQCPIR